MRKIYKNPFPVYLWGTELNSYCLSSPQSNSLRAWLIPLSPFRWGGCRVVSPGYLHFILQVVLDADWALWAWLCFSLRLVLSGLLYPETPSIRRGSRGSWKQHVAA